MSQVYELTHNLTASAELQSAFNDFLSSSSQRGLIVGISTNPEQLVPKHSIQSSSADFSEDLSNLAPHVKDNEAMYIILRQHASGESKAAGTCVAITYVPDKAPVRQKMLFASTRLTLVRELGWLSPSKTSFTTAWSPPMMHHYLQFTTNTSLPECRHRTLHQHPLRQQPLRPHRPRLVQTPRPRIPLRPPNPRRSRSRRHTRSRSTRKHGYDNPARRQRQLQRCTTA